MSENFGMDDFKEMLKAMSTMKKLKEKADSALKENECKSCNHDYTDDDKMIIDFQDDFKEMINWAFGKYNTKDDRIAKADAFKMWAELHPALPSIKIPIHASNEAMNIILAMQISPHWYAHKKLKK